MSIWKVNAAPRWWSLAFNLQNRGVAINPPNISHVSPIVFPIPRLPRGEGGYVWFNKQWKIMYPMIWRCYFFVCWLFSWWRISERFLRFICLKRIQPEKLSWRPNFCEFLKRWGFTETSPSPFIYLDKVLSILMQACLLYASLGKSAKFSPFFAHFCTLLICFLEICQIYCSPLRFFCLTCVYFLDWPLIDKIQ